MKKGKLVFLMIVLLVVGGLVFGISRMLSDPEKYQSSNVSSNAIFDATQFYASENVANYLEKGRLVGVQGRIQTGFYNKDDNTRVYTTEVIATNVEFLEWGDKKKEEKGQDEYWDGYIEQFHPTDNDDIPF